MRKSGMAIFLLGACVLMLAACGNETEHREKTQHYITETDTRNLLEETEEENGKTGDIQMQKMIVEVSGQRFEADLFDNETVQALSYMLPMTINMEEMHGNEKYDYLDEELPSNPENIGSIKTGDIMLFGSDCIVLFFKDFDTSYNYTRIGHIKDEAGFANALSGGTVEVTFGAGE